MLLLYLSKIIVLRLFLLYIIRYPIFPLLVVSIDILTGLLYIYLNRSGICKERYSETVVILSEFSFKEPSPHEYASKNSLIYFLFSLKIQEGIFFEYALCFSE